MAQNDIEKGENAHSAHSFPYLKKHFPLFLLHLDTFAFDAQTHSKRCPNALRLMPEQGVFDALSQTMICQAENQAVLCCLSGRHILCAVPCMTGGGCGVLPGMKKPQTECCLWLMNI